MGQSAHLMPKHVVQVIIDQTYARRRFVNRNVGHQRQYKTQTSLFFHHTLRSLKFMLPKSSL
ncbi:hypothetical protein Pyn_37555 [Prunus yedoensis var. nudiflora]|uniref:Uncharacterized protein n=1 Tax=Prunus yedoensis var. nudiflora TaxID=2094558 RepID=A0A314YIT7_PRUYE|nr:hypothetical protein Pyn_37555 [Prunus yedoensis var. nudiflora]